MSEEDYRAVLSAARANGADDGDEAIARALEASKSDPELAAWLEEERAADMALSGQLSEVMPPEDLRERLLALDEAVPAEVIETQKGAVPFPVKEQHKRFWPKGLPLSLAAAAVLVVGLTLSLLSTLLSGGDELEAFTVAMQAEFVDHSSDMFKASTFTAVNAHLSEHAAPLPEGLPPGLSSDGLMGCRVIEHDGYRVTMLCWSKDGTKHLYVVDIGNLPEDQLPREAVRRQHGSFTDLMWRREDKLYYLVSESSDDLPEV